MKKQLLTLALMGALIIPSVSHAATLMECKYESGNTVLWECNENGTYTGTSGARGALRNSVCEASVVGEYDGRSCQYITARVAPPSISTPLIKQRYYIKKSTPILLKFSN